MGSQNCGWNTNTEIPGTRREGGGKSAQSLPKGNADNPKIGILRVTTQKQVELRILKDIKRIGDGAASLV
jgi:hypothetical protein